MEKASELSRFKPAQVQFNAGTEKGGRILERSIRTLGCGRSVLVDKNDTVICGNKLLQAAINTGITKVRVVETNGDELVIVKRTDLDANTRTGYEMAVVDNLSTQESLNWDLSTLQEIMNTHWGFDPRDWGSSISWLEKLNIDDFFTELEKDKKMFEKVGMPQGYEQASLFDYFEGEEEGLE